MGHDKIRILIIDDKPEGLCASSNPDGPPVPHLPSEYAPHFEFRWLATPAEGRDYRDLSWFVAEHNAPMLGEHGWVPEIVIIDYALTQDSQTVAQRVEGDEEFYRRISPLPDLQYCAYRLNAVMTTDARELGQAVPSGQDTWGCFIGGLVLATFADHPCAPVTITRYSRNPDTLAKHSPDAAFFEWLMTSQTSGLLRADGRAASPRWSEIIEPGTEQLRRRLVALAKAGIVEVSLDDVLALAGNGTHPVLTITSRYARRAYPTVGLFVDKKDNPKEWSESLLADIWNEGDRSSPTFQRTLRDLRRGQALAKLLWTQYCDMNPKGAFVARQQLSELRARAKGQLRVARPLERQEESRLWELNKAMVGRSLSEGEQEELNTLNSKTGVEPLSEQDRKDCENLHRRFGIADWTADSPQCESEWVDLRHPEFASDEDRRARRWAVLVVIVQLLHRRWYAIQRARRALDDAFTGPHELPALLTAFTPRDIYLALFPVPLAPASLPWHDRRIDVSGYWKSVIDDLNLDLKNVLDGVEKKGPTPGERRMMRMCASALGAGDSKWSVQDWQADERVSLVLYGREPGVQ